MADRLTPLMALPCEEIEKADPEKGALRREKTTRRERKTETDPLLTYRASPITNH